MEMTFLIEKVKKGMILSKAVNNPKTKTIIAPAGTVLSDRYIEIISSNGVTELDIELSPEEMEFYNNANAALIMAADYGFPTTLSRESSLKFKKSITPIRKNGRDFLNVQEVVTSAASMKVEITHPAPNPFTKGNLSYNLSDYRTSGELTDAAVRIATYATMLANEYNKQGGIPRAKMIDETEIALAALLHNYGAICVNDDIRLGITIPDMKRYFPALTDKTIEIITKEYNPRFIPLYSYVLLRNKAELFESSVIKSMIVNSRENRKGTGPLRSNKLEGDTRSVVGALIISLCAAYDEALMNGIRTKQDPRAADDVLTNAYYSGEYDRPLIDLFRKCIPLYPVGTKVVVYNEHSHEEEYAIVTDNNARKDNYRNPIVLTIPGNETIDLSRTSRSRLLGLVSDEVEYTNINMQNANNSSLSTYRKK